MSARRSCSRIVLLLWLACAPAAPIWADTTAPQYDPNGNLTSRATALGTTDYSYDALDRLKTEFGPGVDQSFGYDGNGNRQSDAANVYTLAPNGNRIQTVNGITQVYDPAGQLLDDGRGRSFAYNAAGRLKEVRVNNALVASYKYNYQGLRTHKITPQGTTLYHYDIQGHLIQTTDQVGTPKQSLHWADDRPIAQVDHTPEGDRLVYLHTDHLNTPRTATDAAGTVVWRWEGGAFGETLPEEDVEGDGVATIINLRLAGQYFDAETGLYYWYSRYYDPKTGRGISPDQMSVAEHVARWQANMGNTTRLPLEINPYAYVANNPLRWIDPTGFATYMCKKPLDALGGEGTRSGPDASGNPLYHQYVCVKNGKLTECSGQDRDTNWPYGPGKPSSDKFDPERCEQEEPDNDCIEQCLIKEFAKPRPWYGLVGPGTNCQEWADDVVTECRKQCKKK